jgi:hypothetical protein
VLSHLVSNGDLHAKNLSVQRGPRGWEPTPVHDVICSFVYGDTLTMALPLLSERNWDRIDRALVVRAATSIGCRSAPSTSPSGWPASTSAASAPASSHGCWNGGVSG